MCDAETLLGTFPAGSFDVIFGTWPYEISDMEIIFSDCEIINLEEDYYSPGVFLKSRNQTILLRGICLSSNSIILPSTHKR